MVKVEVLRISYHPANKGYAIILKEVDANERIVPILVGSNEAQSIAMSIEGIQLPRPMTHDLIINIFDRLSLKVKHIVISDFKEGTFFAKIVVLSDSLSNMIEIDSRPSDAIAIAIKSFAPIYISESIFTLILEEKIYEKSNIELNSYNQKTVSHDEVLKSLQDALQKAVEEEEYEIAARIRDRISEIKKDF